MANCQHCEKPNPEGMFNCPSCGEINKDNIDLTSLKDKEIDHSGFKNGVNEFGFDLPASKRKITYKILTQKDEIEVTAELKALKKVSSGQQEYEVTTRLKKAILSVDGNDDPTYIRSFVDEELLSRDSFAIRDHLIQVTPDIDANVVITNENDGSEVETAVPLTVEFFWPSARV